MLINLKKINVYSVPLILFILVVSLTWTEILTNDYFLSAVLLASFLGVILIFQISSLEISYPYKNNTGVILNELNFPYITFSYLIISLLLNTVLSVFIINYFSLILNSIYTVFFGKSLPNIIFYILSIILVLVVFRNKKLIVINPITFVVMVLMIIIDYYFISNRFGVIINETSEIFTKLQLNEFNIFKTAFIILSLFILSFEIVLSGQKKISKALFSKSVIFIILIIALVFLRNPYVYINEIVFSRSIKSSLIKRLIYISILSYLFLNLSGYFFSRIYSTYTDLKKMNFCSVKTGTVLFYFTIAIIIFIPFIFNRNEYFIYNKNQYLLYSIIILLFLKTGLIGITSLLIKFRDKSIFQLPFFPLVPFLTIIITLFVLSVLESLKVPIILFLLLYLIYFLFIKKYYIKNKYVETSDEKAVVSEKIKSNYKLLIPVANPDSIEHLLKLGSMICDKKNGEIILLQVNNSSFVQKENFDDIEINDNRSRLKNISLKRPYIPFKTLTRKSVQPVEAILQAIKDEQIDLVILGWSSNEKKLSSILKIILETAVCDVLISRKGSERFEDYKELILPWSEKETPEWDEIARILSEYLNIPLKYLSVFEKGKKDTDYISGKILEKVKNNSIVIIGNRTKSLFDNLSPGTISLSLAENIQNNIFLIRPFPGIINYYVIRLVAYIDSILPDVRQEEKIDFYKNLTTGARPSIDYYMMVLLSSIIATLGLILNSGAVIIGAMLVAPLMTPIISSSFGIAAGEFAVLKNSLSTLVKGFLMALFVSIFIATIFQGDTLSNEILARTSPTVIDLIVAMASGLAGAYALANSKVSASLPGVAIAAALMPPICAAGICITMGMPLAAGGAILLFASNLVGISFSSGVLLLFMGLQPKDEVKYSKTKVTVITGFILFVSVAALLFSIGRFSISENIRIQNIKEKASYEIEEAGYSVKKIEVYKEDNYYVVNTKVAGEFIPEKDIILDWQNKLETSTGKIVIYEIDFIIRIY